LTSILGGRNFAHLMGGSGFAALREQLLNCADDPEEAAAELGFVLKVQPLHPDHPVSWVGRLVVVHPGERDAVEARAWFGLAHCLAERFGHVSVSATQLVALEAFLSHSRSRATVARTAG
jgi:hypothetical protein